MKSADVHHVADVCGHWENIEFRRKSVRAGERREACVIVSAPKIMPRAHTDQVRNRKLAGWQEKIDEYR